MFNSTKLKVWCSRHRKSFQSEKNFQGEPEGEIFMSRFGCKIWLMPFALITTAMGYLTTRGSHDLRLVSDPSSSSAVQCIRLPESFPSYNEVSHSRIDIACSCPACVSNLITITQLKKLEKNQYVGGKKNQLHIFTFQKWEWAQQCFLAKFWSQLWVLKPACSSLTCTCNQLDTYPSPPGGEGRMTLALAHLITDKVI